MGINLNGAAVTVGGNQWRSYSTALSNGLSVTSPKLASSSLTPSPPVDADTRAMLNTGIWRGDSLSLAQTLPNGGYSVYLWVLENYRSNHRSFDLAVEGATIDTGLGVLAFQAWERYGPYSVTVGDGSLSIVLVDRLGEPHLMGLEIHSAAGGP